MSLSLHCSASWSKARPLYKRGYRTGETTLGSHLYDQQVQVLRAVELTELKKAEEKFKLGIRVYEPSEDGTWRLIRQPAHYEAVGIKPMTIGWYDGHAFLIKDIKKVANILRLCPLQSTVYTSNPSTAPRRSLYKWQNRSHLPRRGS